MSVPSPSASEPSLPIADLYQSDGDFLYSKGTTLDIARHYNPPAPFGSPGYRSGPVGPDFAKESQILMKTARSKQVFDRLPRGTKRPDNDSKNLQTHVRLVIEKELSTGRENGSQVVLCSVKKQPAKKFCTEDHPLPLPKMVVAKIYDPLYYPYPHWLADRPGDVVTQADSEFSREVAAYRHLKKKEITGQFAPEFYGCFTTPVYSEVAKCYRPVCLIIIEYIDGLSISSMCSQSRFPEDPLQPGVEAGNETQRMLVYQQLMEGLATMSWAGLTERSATIGNIIVCWSKSQGRYSPPDGTPRTVLVCYSNASVVHLTPRECTGYMLLDRPMSPVDEEIDEDFMGWIPLEYFEKPDKWQKWLLDKFGGVHAAKYCTREDRERAVHAYIKAKYAEEAKQPQDDTPEVKPLGEGAPSAARRVTFASSCKAGAEDGDNGTSTQGRYDLRSRSVSLPPGDEANARGGNHGAPRRSRRSAQTGSESSVETQYSASSNETDFVDEEIFDVEPRRKRTRDTHQVSEDTEEGREGVPGEEPRKRARGSHTSHDSH